MWLKYFVKIEISENRAYNCLSSDNYQSSFGILLHLVYFCSLKEKQKPTQGFLVTIFMCLTKPWEPSGYSRNFLCSSSGSSQINSSKSKFQTSIHNNTVKCIQGFLILSISHHSLKSWSIEPRKPLCRASYTLGIQCRGYFWSYALCIFSLFSAFSMQNSWNVPKKVHMEGRLLVYVVIRGDNRVGMERGRRWDFYFFFSFQKTDIDFVIAIDFGLDSS